jgi:hypothetical protein
VGPQPTSTVAAMYADEGAVMSAGEVKAGSGAWTTAPAWLAGAASLQETVERRRGRRAWLADLAHVDVPGRAGDRTRCGFGEGSTGACRQVRR